MTATPRDSGWACGECETRWPLSVPRCPVCDVKEIQSLYERIERIGALACDLLTAVQPWERQPSLREAAELAVIAALPLLPLNGSWLRGYRLSECIDPVLSATIEEWSNAAQAIADLHAALTTGDVSSPPKPAPVGPPGEQEQAGAGGDA